MKAEGRSVMVKQVGEIACGLTMEDFMGFYCGGYFSSFTTPACK